ncbi:MAG: hypothetical protein U1E87_02860 [Alphaproteobacteria bacterium]
MSGTTPACSQANIDGSRTPEVGEDLIEDEERVAARQASAIDWRTDGHGRMPPAP